MIYGVLFLFIGVLYIGFALLVSYGIRRLTGGNEFARIAVVLLTAGIAGGVFEFDFLVMLTLWNRPVRKSWVEMPLLLPK